MMKGFLYFVALTLMAGCATIASDGSVSDLHPGLQNAYYNVEPRYIRLPDVGRGEEVLMYPQCNPPQICGNLAYISCGVDGISDYVDNTTGEIISSCGGVCHFGFSKEYEECRSRCPPREWKCN
jgi:hypothetical protein